MEDYVLAAFNVFINPKMASFFKFWLQFIILKGWFKVEFL